MRTATSYRGDCRSGRENGSRSRGRLPRSLSCCSSTSPLPGLNPAELDESIGIIRKIKDRGITIMIIEHHMKVIMAISDRIVVLNYGEKIAEGTPLQIRSSPLVVEAYLGEAQSA